MIPLANFLWGNKRRKIVSLAILGIIVIVIAVDFTLSLHGSHNQVTRPTLKDSREQLVVALEKKIKQTSSVSERYQLDTQLGTTYMNLHNYSAAIEAYQDAADVSGHFTAQDALNLANAYQQQDDKAQAVKYYQKAINLWPKNDPSGGATVENLQQTIKSLQGES